MRKPLAVLLLLFAVPAFAQEVTASLDTGGATFQKGDTDEEFFLARGSLTADFQNGLYLIGRVDLDRTLDGGALDQFPDPSTFRSIQGMAGFLYRFGGAERRFGIGAIGGVTWSAEGDAGAPVDPRLYTYAGVLRYSLPHDGYVYVGVGQHDPVGGPALLVSVMAGKSGDGGFFDGGYVFSDYVLPLDQTAFQNKAWTWKSGVLVRFWSGKL